MRRAYHRNINTSGLAVNPDLPDDTEVASGRQIDGKDTFYKLVTKSGNLTAVNQSHPHNITGIDRAFSLQGSAKRDDVNNQDILFHNPDATTQRNIFLSIDDTNLSFNIGTLWAGAGDTLSELRVFVEYTKL